MPPVHGSKAFFSIADAGNTVRDLSALISSSGMPYGADTAEVTTGGSTSKKYIPGLKDGTIPIEGPIDATLDGYLWGIVGVERAFVYRPQGTGTGLPNYAGFAILQSYEPDTPVDDAGTWSGEFQITGDVTRTLQP
jgi:hypothetical protein